MTQTDARFRSQAGRISLSLQLLAAFAIGAIANPAWPATLANETLVTVEEPACTQPALILPRRDVKIEGEPGTESRSGTAAEVTVVAMRRNNDRLDFDGDGVCDSLQFPPLSDGTNPDETADERLALLFEHDGQVLRFKPNLPARTIRRSLPLFSPGRPPVLWEGFGGFFDTPTVPRPLHRWNTAAGRFDTLTDDVARPYLRHLGLLLYVMALDGAPWTEGKESRMLLPWNRLPYASSPPGPIAMQRIAAMIEGAPVSFNFNKGLWQPERWTPYTRHLAFRVLLYWQSASGGRNPLNLPNAKLSRILKREYLVAPVAKKLSGLGVRNALLLLRELRAEFPRAPEIAFMEAIVAMRALQEMHSLFGWRYKDVLPDPKRTAQLALQVARDNYVMREPGFNLAVDIEDAQAVLSAGEALPMPAWTASWTLWPLFKETLDWPHRRPTP